MSSCDFLYRWGGTRDFRDNCTSGTLDSGTIDSGTVDSGTMVTGRARARAPERDVPGRRREMSRRQISRTRRQKSRREMSEVSVLLGGVHRFLHTMTHHGQQPFPDSFSIRSIIILLWISCTSNEPTVELHNFVAIFLRKCHSIRTKGDTRWTIIFMRSLDHRHLITDLELFLLGTILGMIASLLWFP